MLPAIVARLPPAFTRFSVLVSSPRLPVALALSKLFRVPLMVWDLRTRGRLHPATLWGGLATVASIPLRLLPGARAARQDFAARLLDLVRSSAPRHEPPRPGRPQAAARRASGRRVTAGTAAWYRSPTH